MVDQLHDLALQSSDLHTMACALHVSKDAIPLITSPILQLQLHIPVEYGVKLATLLRRCCKFACRHLSVNEAHHVYQGSR